MIGKFNFEGFRLLTDSRGQAEIILTVSPDSKYAAKELAKDLVGGTFTAVIDKYRRKRSLDQNALLWALLTIYSQHDGDTPEDIYYRVVSRHGSAQYLCALPGCEPILKRNFRVVKKIDTRYVNGAELGLYKCVEGSSKYDTQEMTRLIDGVFYELAQIGVDARYDKELVGYYNDWRDYKEAKK